MVNVIIPYQDESSESSDPFRTAFREYDSQFNQPKRRRTASPPSSIDSSQSSTFERGRRANAQHSEQEQLLLCRMDSQQRDGGRGRLHHPPKQRRSRSRTQSQSSSQASTVILSQFSRPHNKTGEQNRQLEKENTNRDWLFGKDQQPNTSRPSLLRPRRMKSKSRSRSRSPISRREREIQVKWLSDLYRTRPLIHVLNVTAYAWFLSDQFSLQEDIQAVTYNVQD